MTATLPTAMPSREELFTIEEAAKHYGVEPVTIWKWLGRAGQKIEHIKRPWDRKTSILRVALEPFVARRKTATGFRWEWSDALSDDFQPRRARAQPARLTGRGTELYKQGKAEAARKRRQK